MLLYVVYYSKKQQTQQASACRDRTGRGSRRASAGRPRPAPGRRKWGWPPRSSRFHGALASSAAAKAPRKRTDEGRDSSIVCRQVARCAQCVPIDECGRISEGRERPARPEGGRKTSPHRVQSSFFGQPHQTTPTINHRRLMSGQPSHGAVRRKIDRVERATSDFSGVRRGQGYPRARKRLGGPPARPFQPF